MKVENMKIDNMKAQMRKGVLEMCILSLLSSEAMYTSDIIDKLRISQLVVVEGTLYPLLTRLKNAGFLEYYWMESNFGPPRKYFKDSSAPAPTCTLPASCKSQPATPPDRAAPSACRRRTNLP